MNLYLCATELDYKTLNGKIRECKNDVVINECYGQRFIGSAAADKTITINGTPGNALGAYLDGADIIVNGNAQDAVGDTMNDGRIMIKGNAGDALGYAMRGGKIFVKGDAGYRTGIHMKQYNNKCPVIVVGGRVGSFLGEYQAGGIIIVLGLEGGGAVPVGNFAGTGMHGGFIYIRCQEKPVNLPEQVTAEIATKEEMDAIAVYLNEFADSFGFAAKNLYDSNFYILKPNAKNPYKQLYTPN